ncbi:LamG domain-containing protein [Flavobacterium pectinovorum]|uniref:LamG domain-containing protein n=1 Tax=Flavobacterium pectinovorum TaxID=29533 RepID=UPI001FAE6E85|nr:LamG domain-containing protein [Flavobacterium pectinovorum]MCI9845784.1 LamG domain-containing protein [Flavobacterium pectinovorum]
MKKILLTLMIAFSANIEAQIPIHEFNFNGTLHNTENTISFMGTENYVSDRMGNEKSAQRLTNKALEAVIDNLPQNDAARTVTIWIKMNDISSPNYIWGYGTAYNAQYFGLLQQGTTSSNSDLSLAGWGASNDLLVNIPLVKNTWYQYSITFDGNTSKIYRNGELLKYIKGMSRDTRGTVFKLGEINTTIGINADFDELKIYNTALSDKEIYDLYNTSKQLESVVVIDSKKNTATKKDNEKKQSESAISTAKPVVLNSKKVEIFSQGQKVLSNNTQEININQLPEGTYLLKVTNLPSKKNISK